MFLRFLFPNSRIHEPKVQLFKSKCRLAVAACIGLRCIEHKLVLMACSWCMHRAARLPNFLRAQARALSVSNQLVLLLQELQLLAAVSMQGLDVFTSEMVFAVAVINNSLRSSSDEISGSFVENELLQFTIPLPRLKLRLVWPTPRLGAG